MAEQKINSIWVFDPEEFDLGKAAKLSDEEIASFRNIAFNIRHPDGKREVPWPSDCQSKREVFGDNLAYQYVYEWQKGNLWTRAYEVEVNAFIGLEYKLDFSGTQNCDIQTAFNKSNNIVTIALQPFEREIIASITCSKIEDNKFNIKGSWSKAKIDPQLFNQSIALSNNKIKADYDKCLAAGLNEKVSWDKMPSIVRNNNVLFVDGEFYPSNDALYYKGNADSRAVRNKTDDEYIMWRRAGDFLLGALPKIFKDSNNLNASIKPEYIRMGKADDAWLISVIAAIALKPQLIANLFLSKDGSDDPSSNNEDKMYGFYRMRLCDRGIWTECILDDILPCGPYHLPVMAHTKDNDQLWPHLIEKLVAKVRGNCYESLDKGSPAAAFADLTGFPTETYDVKECDLDLVFSLINKSYNGGGYDMLAVAVCNEDNAIDNVEQRIGLLSTQSYSVLGINISEERIRLRDPFGRNEDKFSGAFSNTEKNNNGIIWVSFAEFRQYFSSVIVCYSANDYKEARQTIDISYDRGHKAVSVPILKLTVPNGGNVEYLGLQQKDIMNDATRQQEQQLDMCLFVLKSNENRDKLDIKQDEAYGYIPMSTQRNKYVKFGASPDDVKSNDLSSGLVWKNGDRLSSGTYFLVPWTSGVQWESEQKADDVRYIGLTVHGRCQGGGGFNIVPVDGISGKDIDPVLLSYAFKYGEKKQWQDLERRHFQCGQLDIYCGRNTCNDKNLLFTMTPSEATNVTNAVGYNVFGINQEKQFKIQVNETVLFAVNVPINAFREYSSVYKYGLQNEWL